MFRKLDKKIQQKVIDKINKANQELSSQKNMDEIADIAIDLIKVRTRLAKGVDKNRGLEKKFIGLKESTTPYFSFKFWNSSKVAWFKVKEKSIVSTSASPVVSCAKLPSQ